MAKTQRKCPKCGALNSKKAVHCGECGKRLRAPWLFRWLGYAAVAFLTLVAAVIVLAFVAHEVELANMTPEERTAYEAEQEAQRQQRAEERAARAAEAAEARAEREAAEAEARAATRERRAEAKALAAQPLEVLSWSCDKEYGFAHVRGEVRNRTNKPIDQVVAVGSFFTKDGQHVKTASALIDFQPLMPGQTSPFDAITSDNPAITNCRLKFRTFSGRALGTFKGD